MMCNKKMWIAFFLLLCMSGTYAVIESVTIPSTVRMGENLAVYGVYDTNDTLCQFVIFDSDNNPVERLSDEYTFSDGSFYAERKMTEPPYYRGDDFNLVVTCGSSQRSGVFTVEQPLGISHPAQKTWEYAFDTANLEALMITVAWGAVMVLLIIIPLWILRMRG